MKDKKSLVVIDSFALIFRAYYAYPPTLRSKDGTLTNVVYGFSTLLLDVLTRFKPSSIVAVYDSATPTIRASEFAEYKAQRKETDPELIGQIPMVQNLLESFDIPVLRVDGYEADDVIATIVKKHQGAFDEVIVVTGDQDLFQLIENNVKIYLAGRTFSKSKLYDASGVKEKLGINPNQVPDYKGLCGDPSDNIPGVAGIGAKSAQILIEEHGSIENVYKNIDKVPKRMQGKLVESYEIAIKSKELATVVSDVPISFSILDAEFHTFDPNDAEAFLRSLDINSLTKKVHKLAEDFGITVQEEDGSESIGLFETPEESDGPTEQRFKKGSFASLDHIFLLADYENENSPVDIKVKSIYSIDTKNSEIKKLSPGDLLEILNDCLDHNCTIVTCGFKELMHCAVNLGFGVRDVDKLNFEDLGFIAQINSFGSKGHEIQDAFDQADIQKPRNLSEQLALLPEVFEILNSSVLSDQSVIDIYELEKSILSLVIRMEQIGIILDLKALEENQKVLLDYKQEIIDKIYEHAEMEFNINSPKQVGEVLFDKLGLPNQSKTKSGAHSTNERTLSKLIDVHPIVQLILDYREVDKLLSTYISALPQYVAGDGRIHATFDQLGTVSGRFSSRNPNLQNIPVGKTKDVSIRDAFVSDKDSFFVAFDYSQQELRILAALSGEEKMIESFNNGEDIHVLTASELFGKKPSEVTKDDRRVGKIVNFSIVYGVSSFGLSENLRIGRAEAQKLIDSYYDTYKQTAKYFDAKRIEIHEKGFAETILGRRRVNGMGNSKQWFVKNAVERELINFGIQGSAADLMKLAMVEIEKILPSYEVELLLQIHDEFLFEYRGKKSDKKFKEFVERVKTIMEGVKEIGVSYKVDVKLGNIWGNMEEVT